MGLNKYFLIQFDILREFVVPFEEGSHCLLFHCPKCVETPHEFSPSASGPNNKTSSLFLNRPLPKDQEFARPDDGFVPLVEEMEFVEFDESVGFPSGEKIGGEFYGRRKRRENCYCGAPAEFLLQWSTLVAGDALIAEEFWVFACSEQCSPSAVWYER